MSGYLDRALKRARLPISVWFGEEDEEFFLSWPANTGAAVETWAAAETPHEATEAYLDLVRRLEAQ